MDTTPITEPNTNLYSRMVMSRNRKGAPPRRSKLLIRNAVIYSTMSQQMTFAVTVAETQEDLVFLYLQYPWTAVS